MARHWHVSARTPSTLDPTPSRRRHSTVDATQDFALVNHDSARAKADLIPTWLLHRMYRDLNQLRQWGLLDQLRLALVTRAIRAGTIFELLDTRFNVDIARYLTNTQRLALVAEWRQYLSAVDHRREYGVAHRGADLLLVYLVEGLARRCEVTRDAVTRAVVTALTAEAPVVSPSQPPGAKSKQLAAGRPGILRRIVTALQRSAAQAALRESD